MDYQQLPAPPNMSLSLVGGGGPTSNSTPTHLQLLQGNPMNNLQILTSMQPPPPPVNNMPLQVLHNLPHIGPNGNSNPANNNNNNNIQNNNLHNSQNLPPPSQLPPLHHNNNNSAGAVNNNNNNNHHNAEEGNRWTQFQVQQLWRHHAYLNGNLFSFTHRFRDFGVSFFLSSFYAFFSLFVISPKWGADTTLTLFQMMVNSFVYR